jgi:hypothetical protein
MTQQQLDRDDYKTVSNIGYYDGYSGKLLSLNPKWSEKLTEAYKNGYDGGVYEKKLDSRKN